MFVSSLFIVGLFSGLIGKLVDTYKSPGLMLYSNAIIAASMLLASLAFKYQFSSLVSLLFILSCLISLSRNAFEIAYDSELQCLSAHYDTSKTISVGRSLHMFGTALSTIASGYVLSAFPLYQAFVCSAMYSFILQRAIFKAIHRQNEFTSLPSNRNRSDGGYPSQDITCNDILIMCVVAALIFPVGQLSNAVLSNFVLIDLGKNSAFHGIVDSAWPIGGLLATLSLSFNILKFKYSFTIRDVCLLCFFSTIVFSYLKNLVGLVLIHALMGYVVWIARIAMDTYLVNNAPPKYFGRIASRINSVFSITSAIVCLMPSIVTFKKVSDYFFYWGLGSALIFAFVLVFYKDNRFFNKSIF